LKVFIYEWVCGGGFLDRDEAPPASLVAEGRAMLSALLDDFSKVPDVDAITIVEPRLLEHMTAAALLGCARSAETRDLLLDDFVRQADATILIAPEFDGVLLRLCTRAEELGGRLLSPGAEFIAIASDKQATAERLHQMGVPVPRGIVLMPGERCPRGFEYPAVLKPIDGCGSIGIRLAHEQMLATDGAGAYRLESLVAGMPASVAVLCGADQLIPLEPCRQRLRSDFSYAGGCLPLDADRRLRAKRLAVSAIKALPPAHGYIGVDLVLGDASDGTADVVLEVNPRYTTSYVGLRAATEVNLAERCLAVSNGMRNEAPFFHRAVAWNPDGKLEVVANDAVAGH
jgi:tyramine---L-glutamate ligase